MVYISWTLAPHTLVYTRLVTIMDEVTAYERMLVVIKLPRYERTTRIHNNYTVAQFTICMPIENGSLLLLGCGCTHCCNSCIHFLELSLVLHKFAIRVLHWQ